MKPRRLRPIVVFLIGMLVTACSSVTESDRQNIIRDFVASAIEGSTKYRSIVSEFDWESLMASRKWLSSEYKANLTEEYFGGQYEYLVSFDTKATGILTLCYNKDMIRKISVAIHRP